MNFAEHLTALRKQRGWSQEELGNQIGVTRQTVSKWEMGQSTPELEKLVELSRLFGMSIGGSAYGHIAIRTNEASGWFPILRGSGYTMEEVWGLVKAQFPHMWGWVQNIIQWALG